jgi:acetyl-CoA acetyltransferase
LPKNPAIIGAYEIEDRLIPNTDLANVYERAARGAILDAGIEPRAIDGLFLSNFPGRMPALALSEQLGLEPRWADSTSLGGTTGLTSVHRAVAAIREGRCSVALIVYGSLNRSSRTELGTGGGPAGIVEDREIVYGHTIAARYGLFAHRHMHEFGTTPEQLAAPAVAARQWAQLNETAVRRDPITSAEVLDATMIATPLTLPMCCVITDGGGAIVVAASEIADPAGSRAVKILGSGERTIHRDVVSATGFTTSAVHHAAKDAFGEAGLAPSEMDLCTVYDSFTITVITALEDAGFCPKGEGGAFVEDGRLGPGGALPTNPDGGGLATNHPGMRGIFLIVELVRQLRGEAGPRQVDGASLGAALGIGGTLDSQHGGGALVLGRS